MTSWIKLNWELTYNHGGRYNGSWGALHSSIRAIQWECPISSLFFTSCSIIPLNWEPIATVPVSNSSFIPVEISFPGKRVSQVKSAYCWVPSLSAPYNSLQDSRSAPFLKAFSIYPCLFQFNCSCGGPRQLRSCFPSSSSKSKRWKPAVSAKPVEVDSLAMTVGEIKIKRVSLAKVLTLASNKSNGLGILAHTT